MAIQAKYKHHGVNSLINEARDLIAENNKDEAVLQLRKAIRLSPHNVDALLLYAQASPSRNNARRTLDKVLTLDPNNSEAKALRHELDKEATWDTLYKPAVTPPMPAIRPVDNKATVTRPTTATASRDSDADTKEDKQLFWLGLFTALFGLFGVASVLNSQLFAELAHLLG